MVVDAGHHQRLDDRVWNNGWAYGERDYPHKRVWMIVIAGNKAASYQSEATTRRCESSLIQAFSDIAAGDRRLDVLYGSIEGKPCPAEIIEDARRIGASF